MGQYKIKIDGKSYQVEVNSISGENASVTVDGKAYEVSFENNADKKAVESTAPAVAAAAPAASASSGAGFEVKAPLPGVIVEISVKPGQSVRRGEKLAVLEAMKMENEIQAETDGTVSSIEVKVGDSVLEGVTIIKLG